MNKHHGLQLYNTAGHIVYTDYTLCNILCVHGSGIFCSVNFSYSTEKNSVLAPNFHFPFRLLDGRWTTKRFCDWIFIIPRSRVKNKTRFAL